MEPFRRTFWRASFVDTRRGHSLARTVKGALLTQPRPGNFRELENLLTRAVVLSTRSILQPSDLGSDLEPIPSAVNLKFAKKAIELDFVKKALSKNTGTLSRAARALGI